MSVDWQPANEQETVESLAGVVIQESTTMTTQTQGKEPVAVEMAARQERSPVAAALLLQSAWATHQAAAKAVEVEHSDLMQAG